ncbi:protein-tyrosine phosphatase-like protein [Haematococcus lacustris]
MSAQAALTRSPCLGARETSTRVVSLWVITTPAGGGLGLCFCPGKRVTRGGVRHERNMQQDLLRLRDTFQISTVACLLNAAELRSFGIRDYAADLAAAGLQTLGLPIIEMGAPECMEKAAMFIEGLALGVSRGDRIAVHCRGGMGRAGLIAACVMLRLGCVADAKEAIKLVRERRCAAAIESKRQEDFVAGYATWLVAQRGAIA